jgi:hypothetical protein
MVPLAKGGVAVAWLDSREMSGEGHHGSAGAMTLRYAESIARWPYHPRRCSTR